MYYWGINWGNSKRGMLTSYKKGDLKNLIEGNHDLYNTYSLIADKLRTIYTALGWTHMTKEFSEADDTVEYLTKGVLESLNEDPQQTYHMTAGLKVCGYFDEEDMLNLDYQFYLA